MHASRSFRFKHSTLAFRLEIKRGYDAGRYQAPGVEPEFPADHPAAFVRARPETRDPPAAAGWRAAAHGHWGRILYAGAPENGRTCHRRITPIFLRRAKVNRLRPVRALAAEHFAHATDLGLRDESHMPRALKIDDVASSTCARHTPVVKIAGGEIDAKI